MQRRLEKGFTRKRDLVQAKKDFYLVSYNGQIGYALQSYLTFI